MVLMPKKIRPVKAIIPFWPQRGDQFRIGRGRREILDVVELDSRGRDLGAIIVRSRHDHYREARTEPLNSYPCEEIEWRRKGGEWRKVTVTRRNDPRNPWVMKAELHADILEQPPAPT